MFKKLSALIRGTAYHAAEDITDRNAVIILDQQIRDCTQALATARRSVAFAQARSEQEVHNHQKILSRIDDLEARTLAALEAGKTELAREAATMIASLEAEKQTSEAVQAKFERELFRLKSALQTASKRLSELRQGQRLAAATQHVQGLKGLGGSKAREVSALKDAEDTLARLQERQKVADLAETALEDMPGDPDPQSIIEKLANAGCGAPLKTSADDVLARLGAKMKTTNPSTAEQTA